MIWWWWWWWKTNSMTNVVSPENSLHASQHYWRKDNCYIFYMWERRILKVHNTSLYPPRQRHFINYESLGRLCMIKGRRNCSIYRIVSKLIWIDSCGRRKTKMKVSSSCCMRRTQCSAIHCVLIQSWYQGIPNIPNRFGFKLGGVKACGNNKNSVWHCTPSSSQEG